MSCPELTIIRANAFLHRSAEVLADFEIETIETVHRRVVYADGAPATPAEAQVIEDALAAMLAAPTQGLTCAGLAA